MAEGLETGEQMEAVIDEENKCAVQIPAITDEEKKCEELIQAKIDEENKHAEQIQGIIDQDQEQDENGARILEPQKYEDKRNVPSMRSSIVEKFAPSAPSDWTSMSNDCEYKLVDLSRYSTEYQKVEHMFKKGFDVSIDRIVRVQNPYLWGWYLLKKAEYADRLGFSVKERELFHCTGRENIESIVKTNLDWRRSSRTKYGQGVSFSPDPDYAHTWSDWNIGRDRALILTVVLVGNTQEGYNTVIPERGYDTTTGKGGQVYVKFCDHEFYPQYVAYYNKPCQRKRSY